jgi:hypothetical protein
MNMGLFNSFNKNKSTNNSELNKLFGKMIKAIFPKVKKTLTKEQMHCYTF